MASSPLPTADRMPGRPRNSPGPLVQLHGCEVQSRPPACWSGAPGGSCSRTSRNPVIAAIRRLRRRHCWRDSCAPSASAPGLGHRSRSPCTGSGGPLKAPAQGRTGAAIAGAGTSRVGNQPRSPCHCSERACGMMQQVHHSSLPTGRRPVGGPFTPVAANSSHQERPVGCLWFTHDLSGAWQGRNGDHVWEKRCSKLDLLACDPGSGYAALRFNTRESEVAYGSRINGGVRAAPSRSHGCSATIGFTRTSVMRTGSGVPWPDSVGG